MPTSDFTRASLKSLATSVPLGRVRVGVGVRVGFGVRARVRVRVRARVRAGARVRVRVLTEVRCDAAASVPVRPRGVGSRPLPTTEPGQG